MKSVLPDLRKHEKIAGFFLFQKSTYFLLLFNFLPPNVPITVNLHFTNHQEPVSAKNRAYWQKKKKNLLYIGIAWWRVN